MTSAPPSSRRAQPGTISLERISLRRREHALLAGGTQVGKTVLADRLGSDFVWRYRREKARRHISDTKPRYRAEWLANGLPARRRYRNWDHGQMIPGSVLIEDPDDMEHAFRLGHRTTICSTEGWAPVQDACVKQFHNSARARRPQLLQVDETKDHFYGNGQQRGEGKLVVVARAGAERGESGLYCTQRTKGIGGDLLEMMTRLYAFRMDNAADAKRFQEFGCPPFDLPTDDYHFRYWYKRADRHRVWGPYFLEL